MPSITQVLGSRRTGSVLTLALAAVVVPTVVFGAGPLAPTSLARPSIEISEVLADPAAVYDSRGEWFEIHNTGSSSADLSGWVITDGQRDRHVIDSLVVPPGGYAVLGRVGDRALNGGIDVDHVYGNEVQLMNLVDAIELRDPTGSTVDRVMWSSSFPRRAGTSMALTTPETDNAVGANWCSSSTVMPRGDLASPGQPTQCAAPAHALVVSEVLQNPAAVSDASGEWFEVHNPTRTDLDLLGYRVQDDAGESFIVESSTPLPAGGYAVLGASADRATNGGVGVGYAYGAAMHLFNTSDTITLADPRGVLVDRLSWDDGLTFPDPDGASMSVVDPAADNARGSNWCTSTLPWGAGDLGTPGAATWCTPRPERMIVVTEVMFDPETPASERSSEWFEIANVGTQTVDLSGWSVTTATGYRHTISALVVAPARRAVLAASGDPAVNGGVTADYVYGVGTLPLYNDVGRIVLEGPTGVIAESVEWSAARGFPMPSGRSIELRSVAADNELGASWCAASDRFGVGDFGTPGAAGACVSPPAPPSVVISEVMRNPFAVNDSAGEWFEVHNLGDQPVDLRNWSITDDASDRHVISESVVVPADGYAVLARSGDAAINGGVRVDYVYGSSIVLVNATDMVAIDDQHGQRVDELAWNDGGLWPQPNGASTARVAGHVPSADPASWCVSGPQFGAGDLGTPGAPNSCVPITERAPVVINEVHRDPAAVTDSVGEWIELYNAGDSPIDVSGWTLRDDGSDAHRISPSAPLVIAPHGYLVLGRERSTALNGGAQVDYSYGLDLILYNSADELSLLDAALAPVDRVEWSAGDAFPEVAGATMSLRSPALDNADWANWCSAVTPYGSLAERGTPGMANSCEPGDDESSSTSTSTTTTTTTTSTTSSTSTSTTTTTTTTVPSGDAYVRVTAMCLAVDGPNQGRYMFRVRHEAGPAPLDFRLQIATTVLYTGTIGDHETQYVFLPVPSAGVKVIPAGPWTNTYTGTASTNTTQCAPNTTSTTTSTSTSTSTTSTSTSTSTSTTSTTVLPPPIVPTSATHSVFTLGDRTCGAGINLSGAEIELTGAVRANADVNLSGSSIKVDGPISVGGTANLGRGAATGPVTGDTTVQPSPFPVAFADFQTSGAWADLVPAGSYELHLGNWRIPDGTLSGVHVVLGDVTGSGKRVELDGASIIATGTITLSGSRISMKPFRTGWPTLMSIAGSCDSTAINLSSSDIDWRGTIVAPNGLFQANGAKIRGGSVIAVGVQASGSDVRFDAGR